MKNPRFWLGDAFICLPLVISVAGGCLFLKTLLPTFEKREADRVRSAYREIAMEIKDGEAEGARTCDPVTRKPCGRMSKGTWGHEASPSGHLVWYRPPKTPDPLGVVVAPIEPYDYRRLFWSVGVLILALMTLLTDIGLRFFRRCTRERDDFLAAAAHDLTTPLVGMRRLIGRDDGEAKRLNERMIRLVENIRDYLQMGGRRRAKRTAFPVGRAFDEAYELFRADFAESESGPVEVTGDRQIQVYADETLMVQVFWNLLGNELKYAAPLGRIRAEFCRKADRFVFVLSDHGPGMTAFQRRHAFDRYFRARTALQSGAGGFGIGLCTARDFARKCGGDLVVEANQPSGCVFVLSLPLARNLRSP